MKAHVDFREQKATRYGYTAAHMKGACWEIKTEMGSDHCKPSEPFLFLTENWGEIKLRFSDLCFGK